MMAARLRPAIALAVLAAVLGLFAAVTPASAYEPDEVLADPALEARARALSAELRCMVCQNQSIDESNAPLARDLRLLVRERLVAGDTDAEVIDFVVARYGEYVLLRPRIAPHTYLLWFGPLLVLLAGGTVTAVYFARRRRNPAAAEPPLTAEERARAEALARNDG